MREARLDYISISLGQDVSRAPFLWGGGSRSSSSPCYGADVWFSFLGGIGWGGLGKAG